MEELKILINNKKEQFQVKKYINSIIKILYYLIPISILIWCMQMVFNNSIWLDEAFSLSMIEQSFVDIIKNTAIDVHPPLYYIIVKFIVHFISIFNENNIIQVCKFISIIPIGILILISYKEVSKLFGKKNGFFI